MNAPVNGDVATLATRYIRDGWPADTIATKFGIDKAWCRAMARRVGTPLSVDGWCGHCTYNGRMRHNGTDLVPCTECNPEETP